MRYDKEGKPIEAYANVHILDLSASKKKGPEGCLSIPNYRGEVSRSDSIVVSYYDINTRTHRTDTVTGYTAVIFQHETDHLEGILYTDRADTVYFNQRWAEERKQYEQEGAYTKPGWWPYTLRMSSFMFLTMTFPPFASAAFLSMRKILSPELEM